MRRKGLIIAIATVMGISAGAGTAITSFAAEDGIAVQENENVFDDGSEDMAVEEPETDTENGFSAGELSEESTNAFQDKETIPDFEENDELAESAMANSEEDFIYKVYGGYQYVEIQEYVGTSSEVVIPSTIKGYPVKVVDGLNKDVIRRLVIPDSVVYLESVMGKNLEDVSLPESLTELPNSCFYGCKNLRYIKIPSKITDIPYNAFGNSGIERIDFPKNLTSIGSGAFSRCSFEKFVVPETVQTIGTYAFSGCENLKEIQLPENLKELSNGIFKGDNCLEKVNYLPDLQNVGEEAFKGTAISSITFSRTLNWLGYAAFWDCENLKYVVFRGRTSLRWLGNITIFAPSTALQEDPPAGDSYPIDSPMNMRLLQENNQITLSWDEVPYINGYKVYRSDSADGNYEQIADITQNTYTDTIDEDQQYYYKVCIYYEFEGDVIEGNFSTIVNNEPVPMNKCRYAYAGKVPTYTGNKISLDMKVTYENQTLTEGKDYTVVKYENNINAGTAYVVVKGIGRFKDECKISFKIQPRNISEADFPDLDKQFYAGVKVKPQIAVLYNERTLKSGKDYSVVYKNNATVGSASAVISGKGNFTGTKVLKFTIVKAKPEKPVILSVTADKPYQLIIRWKKAKRAQGYEIYCKSEFDRKYYIVKTISNINTTKLVDNWVIGDAKHTYKIRSYYILNRKKVYSAYSTPKSKTALSD